MPKHSAYIGRFAPTPSGLLHRGSLVAALGSYLDARAHGGRWLLRIEDVDLSRRRQHFIDDALFRLEALHLYWDGLSFQSQHLPRYAHYLEQLAPHLYYCDCSRQSWQAEALPGALGWVYPRHCRGAGRRQGALRLALPEQSYGFDDRFLGAQCQDLSALGDPVLRRRDGVFMYVLAATVDDYKQGISHVVRGADLLPMTALQMHLQALLGWPTPQYGHLPLLRDEQGKKLSKSSQAAAYPLRIQSLYEGLAFLGLRDLPETDDMDALLAVAVQQWQKRWRIQAQ